MDLTFSDLTVIAGLLNRAWFLVANAGWAGTGKPDGWEQSAMAWKADYETWLAAMAKGPQS